MQIYVGRLLLDVDQRPSRYPLYKKNRQTPLTLLMPTKCVPTFFHFLSLVNGGKRTNLKHIFKFSTFTFTGNSNFLQRGKLIRSVVE